MNDENHQKTAAGIHFAKYVWSCFRAATGPSAEFAGVGAGGTVQGAQLGHIQLPVAAAVLITGILAEAHAYAAEHENASRGEAFAHSLKDVAKKIRGPGLTQLWIGIGGLLSNIPSALAPFVAGGAAVAINALQERFNHVSESDEDKTAAGIHFGKSVLEYLSSAQGPATVAMGVGLTAHFKGNPLGLVQVEASALLLGISLVAEAINYRLEHNGAGMGEIAQHGKATWLEKIKGPGFTQFCIGVAAMLAKTPGAEAPFLAGVAAVAINYLHERAKHNDSHVMS